MRGLLVRLLLLLSGAIGGCNAAVPSATPAPVIPATEMSAFVTATDVPVSPTVAIVRTPVPSVICAGLPAPRLIVHERAQIVDDGERLNLRASPNTDAPIIDRIASGDVVFVLAGPECGAAYVWFRVRYGNDIGWIAEGERNEYYVRPYP